MSMRNIISRSALLAAAALLSACGTVASLQPGMTRAEVQSHWGTPTRVVPLASGERLQYSFQPHGQQAVMVDLDAAGRVVQARQVLNAQDFARISTQGDWTRADVEREFGPPMSVDAVASWDGPIMNYRWRDAMVDQLFHIYLDRAGVVRRAHPGPDPSRYRRLW